MQEARGRRDRPEQSKGANDEEYVRERVFRVCVCICTYIICYAYVMIACVNDMKGGRLRAHAAPMYSFSAVLIGRARTRASANAAGERVFHMRSAC